MWRGQLEAAAFTPAAGPTFQAAVVRWAAEVLSTSLKPSAARRYLTSIKALDPVFGRMALADITTAVVAEFNSSRSGRVTNATIRRDLTALSGLMSACVAWGWLPENPVARFDRRLVREVTRTLYIPGPTDLAFVMERAPADMAPVLSLLRETGAREAEITTLDWPEVDAARQQIALLRTKTSRPRVLRWLTPGGDAGRVLSSRSGEGAVFPTARTGEGYRNFASAFGKLMRNCVAEAAAEGRPFRRFRAHDLRHRFAIEWLKAGGDIYRLSRHLGHTSVRTTERYLAYLTDDELDAVRGVEQKGIERAEAAQSPQPEVKKAS